MAPPVESTTSSVAVTAIPVKKVSKSASGPTLRKRKSLNASSASDTSSLYSTFGEVELVEQTFLWGCELSRSKDTFVAKYPVEGDSEYETDYPEHHQLVLKGATLGADAKEKERNVVEVHFASELGAGEEQRLALASLTLGVMDTCRLDLSMSWTKGRDLTFKLIKGSGPVSLLGNHIVLPSPDVDRDDSLFVPDTDATEDEEMEESGMSTDGDEIEASEVRDLKADKEKPVANK